MLREAKFTAFINDWDDVQKIRYLSDRLRGEAAEWLQEYLIGGGTNDYTEWKEALIARFRNDADVEKLKHALQNLKQGPDQ